MTAYRTFYAPWPNDPAMYPGPVLERHQAHCRALQMPYETHPRDIAPKLTDDARAAGDRAAAMYRDMIAWAPEHYDPNYTATVKQDILRYVDAMRYLAFYGGRGGSKSHDAVEACVELASERKERVVVGREYLESIRDSSHKLFKEKILASRWANQWTITDREMRNNVTGSVITFMGINRNPDSVRSLEGCTIFLGEEAEAFSDASLEILLPTIRAGGSTVIFLWNPADHGSPMNNLFITGEPPERSYVRCVLGEDNKYFYRTELPGERRTAFNRLPTAKYRHIWRGALDVNPEKLVFQNWSIGRVDISDTDLQPRYGIDWGWVDPFAAIEVFVIEPDDPETERGTIYISAEVYERRLPARQIPERLDEAMPRARMGTITADSAEPKSIEELGNKGFHVVPARKGPGSIRAGINKIQGYDIVISPDCPSAASEAALYSWKTDKAGNILRDPVDADNHLIGDALRYALEDYEPPAQGGGVVRL